MDDSLKELETELKGLRLRQPSASLIARLERELAEEIPAHVPPPPPRPRYTSATNLSSWKWLGWRTASLAAACAIIAGVTYVNLRQPIPASPTSTPLEIAATANPAASADRDALPARYQPVAATNVLYDLQDEGYVVSADDTSARQVRARYVDTYTWKNPRSNASLKWSVPRDEVRVIPTSWH